MLEFLPLELFPGGGFDKSIVPVIFIGLLVLWGFAETYGFVFTGLVVPGYLAAVEVIAPASAVVVFLESLVTYGVVWGLSDGIGKRGIWSPFFGRDRFFAFLVVSVVVRLVGGLWLWPATWEFATTSLGLSASPPGPLSSLGLVLVPLTANMFWKLGVARGCWQILLPSGITWAFTTYILLPYTNLRFSEFRLNFEDVAVDFLASSRTYIVLLVAAALSARLNKRYGWDFGGILVPALLAVTWYTPSKALITFAEVLVLAGVATALVSAPVIRNWNLEGPRRLILVFTAAFLLKYATSWVVVAFAPSVRMTDFFGFGYLLSSLLALKVLQKDAASTVVPAFAVSLAGFLLGSGVALGIQMTRLSAVDPAPITLQKDAPVEAQPALPTLVSHTALLQTRPSDGRAISNAQLRQIESIGKRIRQSFREGKTDELAGLGPAAGDIGLEWLKLRERDGRPAYLLAEPVSRYPSTDGWGLYLFRPEAGGPVVQVPRAPRDAVEVLGLYVIARALDARALMIGVESRSPAGRIVEPRFATQTPFHRLHRTLADWPVIQFRIGDQDTDSQLFVRRRLASRLPTDTLEELFGNIPLSWNVPPGVDRQREVARATFTTVRLDADDLLQAIEGLAEERFDDPRGGVDRRATTLQNHLEARVLGEQRRLAHSAAALGPAPSRAEFATVARSLVARLIRLARNPEPGWRTDRIVASLRLLADTMNLDLRRILVDQSRQCLWELSEGERPFRGVGLVYVRCQAGAPLLLEVPRPINEQSSWRLGALLSEGLDARALVLGSSSRPNPERPPSSALEQPSMLVSVHRWIHREYLSMQPPWTLQVRGLSAERRLAGDVLLSLDDPVWPDNAPGATRALADWLTNNGLQVLWDHGRPHHADLRGFSDDTLRYSRQIGGGRFARLWFSAPMRHRLTPDPSPEDLRPLLDDHGFDAEEGSITDALRANDAEPEASVDQLREIADRQEERLRRFARTVNPIHLRDTLEGFRDIDAAPRVLLDSDRGQVWVLASARDGSKAPITLAFRLQWGDATTRTLVARRGQLSELGLLTATRVWSRPPMREAP